jgi:RNA polymerase sigma factor (sigma-70 family)
MHENSETSLSRVAKNIAEIAKRLSDKGLFRESLLLRLVVGGITLKRAVSFRTSDVADGFSLGRELDPYCVALGMTELRMDVVSHIRRNISEKENSDYPLFPSRKGGNSITTRTAERLLPDAFTQIAVKSNLTFRTAGDFGRKLRLVEKTVVSNGEEGVLEALPRIRKQVTAIFPYHIHDQEDAEQTVVVNLLEERRRRELPESEINEFSDKALRRFRRNRSECRRTELTGLLGDWAMVNNRFNAKLSSTTNASEAEITVNDKHAHAQLMAILKTLPARDERILKMRVGLDRRHPFVRTRAEVAALFNISPERVRQIEIRSIRRLQQPSRAAEVVGFLD